jgi:hypothetical protein
MSPRRNLALLFAAALVLAACGDGDDAATQPPAGEPTTTEVPTPTPPAEPAPAPHEPAECSGAELVTTADFPTDVPEATASTLLAIRSAAQACDYDTLAGLALADGTFTATFGQDFDDPGALADHWRQREPEDQVTAVLVRLTTLTRSTVESTGPDGSPTTLHVAPRALHEDGGVIRQEVVDAFGPEAEQWWADGQYLGWRLGVTDDGHWWFFVSGD